MWYWYFLTLNVILLNIDADIPYCFVRYSSRKCVFLRYFFGIKFIRCNRKVRPSQFIQWYSFWWPQLSFVLKSHPVLVFNLNPDQNPKSDTAGVVERSAVHFFTGVAFTSTILNIYCIYQYLFQESYETFSSLSYLRKLLIESTNS